MPYLTPGPLVVASHNEGKIREFRLVFAPAGIEVLSAGDASLPEPEETGETFLDNAILKVRSAVEHAAVPALADDSGLAIDALHGAPGVYSARWAGPEKDFNAAFERINTALGGPGAMNGAEASFVCVLAMAWPDGAIESAEGRCTGRLVWPPRGENGFGYDPVFVPAGETRTFAEMTGEEKAGFSHRMAAWTALQPKILRA